MNIFLMRAIRQQNDCPSPYYWCHFVIGNQRIRESTGVTNKEAAKLYEAKRKAEVWEQQKLGTKPKRPWPDAVVRWLKEKSHKKSISDDIATFAWLDPYLKHRNLQDIDEEPISTLVDARLAEDVANATVIRMLATVHAVMNLARKQWRWIDSVPAFPKLAEPPQRVRWLTAEEVDRLLAELPLHKRDMSEFSLETGLRASNVAKLEWSQVDLERRCAWVYAEDSKSNKAFGIPLSDRAVEIIQAQAGKHPIYVFTYTHGKKRNTATHQRQHEYEGLVQGAEARWHH